MHFYMPSRIADRVCISSLSVNTLYHNSSTCAIDIVHGETDRMTKFGQAAEQHDKEQLLQLL